MRTAFPAQALRNFALSPVSTRSLTTRPRRAPKYTNVWDPTYRSRTRPGEPAPAQTSVRIDYAAHKYHGEKSRAAKGISLSDPHLGRKHAIRRLERCLYLCFREVSDYKLRAQLWRAYYLAKEFAPDRLLLLPDRAWDVLWNSHAVQRTHSRVCRAHLEELHNDMKGVGQPLSLEQSVAYWESLFYNGKQEEALKEWDDQLARFQTDAGTQLEARFLESGLRMHAEAGRVGRAGELLELLYKKHPLWNTDAMRFVFRALTSSEEAHHHDIARDMYTKMRKIQDGKTTLAHLNVCFVGFIHARHLQYAKEVFGDMVTDGFIGKENSGAHVDYVLGRLQLLYRLATDIAKATSICLHAVTILPRSYHSRIFGEWMKLAVTESAPEAAAQILDMMFKHGHEPETYHFNLLLRALFRTKQKPHELRAENIGWHMLEGLAKSRETSIPATSEVDVSSRKQEADMLSTSDAASPRRVPHANAATIALLMGHHALLSQWEHVDYLARQMQAFEIQPNADTMHALMENECRQGNYNKVWEIYASLTDVPKGAYGVFPSGATLRTLWRTLRLALGDHQTRETNTLPSPRELLAETIRWCALVRSRYDAERFRIGLAGRSSESIHPLIMHCFSYTNDLAGSLVAMHALRHHLDIFPSHKAADILQHTISWVDMHKDLPATRRQYSRHIHPKKLEHMAGIYHLIQDARFKRMNLSGDQYAYMSIEEKGDLYLNILSEFVRVVWKRQLDPKVIEEMIDQARKDIGLPDLSTGDMDASAVA